jgi:hypothetical protein
MRLMTERQKKTERMGDLGTERQEMTEEAIKFVSFGIRMQGNHHFAFVTPEGLNVNSQG